MKRSGLAQCACRFLVLSACVVSFATGCGQETPSNGTQNPPQVAPTQSQTEVKAQPGFEPPAHIATLSEQQRERELVDAITNDNLPLARWLLEEGVCANAKGEHNVSALHAAARSGHVEIAQILIDRGADVHALDPRNATPLHWAVRSGDPGTVTVLLQHGADVHAEANYPQRTPLALARLADNHEVIQILLAHGAQR